MHHFKLPICNIKILLGLYLVLSLITVVMLHLKAQILLIFLIFFISGCNGIVHT